MKKFVVAAKKFFSRKDGASLVEYGLLVGLIAVICVAAIKGLGSEISTAFSNISTSLSSAL